MTENSWDSAGAQADHLPELDGLRGVAILGVLLSHAVNFMNVVPLNVPGKPWGQALAAIFLPGWGGVDLFFTLSGFLITGILLRSRSLPTYFPSFYMRRVLRIFPLYYGFLVGSLLLARVVPFVSALLPGSLIDITSYFLYLQNWPVFWTSWAGLTSVWGVFWSLAVEEQFYLVWPALVRFISTRGLQWVCGAGLLMGFPLRFFMIQHFGLKVGIMQWPFSRLDGLFLGAAIAIYACRNDHPVPLIAAKISGSLGAAILLWIGIRHPTEISGGYGEHIWTFGVLAFVLISGGVIVAVQHQSLWTHRLLTFKPLTIAGKISYGMYVYHLLIFFVLGRFSERHLRPLLGVDYSLPFAITYIALAIAMTVLVSLLSYRFVEKPFLKLKRHFPSRNPLAAAASLEQTETA